MTTSRNMMLITVSVSLLSAAACAPAMRPADGPLSAAAATDAPRDGSRGDQIPLRELKSVRGATAEDAVRQLRPDFLRTGGRRMNPSAPGAAPSVYVNGRYAGEPDVLRMIPLRVLIEVRHLDPVAAKSMFGSSCPCDGGVILLRTR